MPVKYGGLPFTEAIEFQRKKLNIVTEHWYDMLGGIHAKAFTVAGATTLDMVEDFHQSMNDMIANGKTITDFIKDFDRIVEKNGWTYKGKRGWRTRVIYDTNMRTARMAGKWKQYQRVKKLRPYLQYIAVDDSITRDLHRQWNKIVLHIDDPWWDTHYPPNDFGCRCSVRSLSERQLKKMGKKLSDLEAPINIENPLEGIGTGWDYNVGKAWLAPDTHYSDKLLALTSTSIRTSAANKAAKVFTLVSDGEYRAFIQNQIDERNIGKIRPTDIIKTIGFIDGDIINKLEAKDISLTSTTIMLSDKERKIIRDSSTTKNRVRKTTGMSQVIPDEYALIIPEIIRNPQAILWDTEKPGLIYAYNIKDNVYLKLVVDINKYRKTKLDEVKERLTSNYLNSAEVVQKRDLTIKRYELFKGKL